MPMRYARRWKARQILGLNMTLNEDMTIADGAMVEGNFDEYPMLRMADLPPINVHFGALSGQTGLRSWAKCRSARLARR